MIQFGCISHQIEWQSLIKEGVIDIEDILCKALGFDWFTCYTVKDERFFIFKRHCESRFEYFIVASYV